MWVVQVTCTYLIATIMHLARCLIWNHCSITTQLQPRSLLETDLAKGTVLKYATLNFSLHPELACSTAWKANLLRISCSPEQLWTSANKKIWRWKVTENIASITISYFLQKEHKANWAKKVYVLLNSHYTLHTNLEIKLVKFGAHNNVSVNQNQPL